jgi:hypothetical protein
VNSGCILVFESLWFLADEDPGLVWVCTPVFLCTPIVLFGLVSRIIVWIVASDAGGGTLFVRFVKDFGLVHLEAGLEVAELWVRFSGFGVVAVFLASDGGEDCLDKLLVFFASLFRFLGVRLPFLLGRLGFLFV